MSGHRFGMHCLLPVLLALSLVSPAARAQGVLVLGDSISAGYGIDPARGWVQLLRQRLEKDCPGLPVKNASVSGETSDGGLLRLPGLLAQHKPDTVVIELGGNDGLRGLPPSRLASNLTAMIRLSRRAGARPVLLGMRIPPNYGQAYTARFAAVFRQVAQDTGVPFDVFLLDGVVAAHQLQNDGIHPTAAAQPTLLDNAWPAIQQALPARCRDS